MININAEDYVGAESLGSNRGTGETDISTQFRRFYGRTMTERIDRVWP